MYYIDMKLDSAVFYSNDIGRVIRFYRDIIGLELEYRQADTYVSFLFSNGARLGVKRAVEEREVPGAQTVFVAIEDIDNFYLEIKSKGAHIIKELQHKDGFGKNFSILDSDKNKVQFMERD